MLRASQGLQGTWHIVGSQEWFLTGTELIKEDFTACFDSISSGYQVFYHLEYYEVLLNLTVLS